MYQEFINKLNEAGQTTFELDTSIPVKAGANYPLDELGPSKNFYLVDQSIVPINLINECFNTEVRNNPIIKDFLPDLLASGQFFYTTNRSMNGDAVEYFGIIKEVIYNENSSIPKITIFVMFKAEWAKAYIPQQPRLWFEVPTPDKLVDLPYFNFRKSLELVNLIRAKYYKEFDNKQLDLIYEPLTWCGVTNRPIFIVKIENSVVGFINTQHLDDLSIAYLLE